MRIAGEIALKSPESNAAKAEALFRTRLRATLSMARLWCDQGKPAADHRTIKAAARRTPPTAASSGNCQKEGPEG
jgi:hypothetical protein